MEKLQVHRSLLNEHTLEPESMALSSFNVSPSSTCKASMVGGNGKIDKGPKSIFIE